MDWPTNRDSGQRRVLRNVPTVDGSQIQQIGLTTSDKTNGLLALKVGWIQAKRLMT